MTQNSLPPSTPAVDENQLIAERREKLKALRAAQAEGKGVAFPNDFKPSDRAADLIIAVHPANPEFTFEGTALAGCTIDMIATDRAAQVTVAAATGAVTVGDK